MPVALPPEEEHKPETPSLRIQEIPITSQVVDTRKQNYDTTLSYLPGFRLATDYYHQDTAPDSAPASTASDRAIPYGQLLLIRGMQLIVAEAWKPVQLDGAGRGWEAKGEGVLYGVITPQIGDVFLADVGDGNNAIFQVNSTERLSIFAETPYRIRFSATSYVNAENLAALNERVTDTFIFSLNNYRNGIKALVSVKEAGSQIRLQNAFRRLCNDYFETFFADRFQTFIMPMQGHPVYDPYVTRFMRSILGTSLHHKAKFITELGMTGDVFYDTPNLFDVILSKDIHELYGCAKKMGIAPRARYRSSPMMASVYMSGVTGVVCPLEVKYSVNHENVQQWPFTLIHKAGPASNKLADILPRLDLTVDSPEPAPEHGSYIHRVLVDEYYVLSKAFYENTGGQSLLENLLHTLLEADPIDINQLAELADYANRFDNLERFYYVPIILAMIKLAPGVL